MSGGESTYLLEGRAFSHRELMDLCVQVSEDPDAPVWKKEVLAFVARYLGGRPVLQESSGTTGSPKKFLLERTAMENSARKTLSLFGLQRGEPVLLCLPVRYIAGKMMIVRALLGGLDLYMVEPSSRPFMQEKRKYGFVPMVPLQLHESLRYGDDITLAGTILIGGAETGSGLRKWLGNTDTPEIFESFGMTETYSHFALRRINGAERDPLFRLLEGVEAATDSRGCLVVDIPGITRGILTTNDMVEIRDGGRAFRWLGRADNLINTGGIKVNPESLEERIGSILGTECVVVALPDERLGMKMVLVAEAAGSADKVKWLASLKEGLESHEVPRHICTVPSLPRTASYKPDRPEARRMAEMMLNA
jgi:O-succinylbenzoic acid--CoA ligase